MAFLSTDFIDLYILLDSWTRRYASGKTRACQPPGACGCPSSPAGQTLFRLLSDFFPMAFSVGRIHI